MPTLYVTEHGARIEKEYKRILVTKDEQILTSIPLFKITDIVLLGSVGVTTPALISLLNNGVDLTIITQSGKMLGKLASTRRDVKLLLQQYELIQNEDFKLRFSKALIRGKLQNSRTLAMRMLRSIEFPNGKELSLQTAIQNIEGCLKKLDTSPDLESVRGAEGFGARSYFSIFRKAVQQKEDLSFNNRNRRPPKDPINVLLSLGYSLLTNSMITAIEVSALDPYAGFFHEEKLDKPALALDLIEEFRPIIIDSIVLRMINERRIKSQDFLFTEDKRCTLSKKGLRKYLSLYNSRLQDQVFLEKVGRRLSYQKLFEVQANNVKALIRNETQEYIPVTLR